MARQRTWPIDSNALGLWLDARGLEQEELARRAGVDVTVISRALNRPEARFYIRIIRNIATALQVDLAWIRPGTSKSPDEVNLKMTIIPGGRTLKERERKGQEIRRFLKERYGDDPGFAILSATGGAIVFVLSSSMDNYRDVASRPFKREIKSRGAEVVTGKAASIATTEGKKASALPLWLKAVMAVAASVFVAAVSYPIYMATRRTPEPAPVVVNQPPQPQPQPKEEPKPKEKPKPKEEPDDRAAAEQVLRLGGRVRLDGKKEDLVKLPAPPERINLTAIMLAKKDLTDQDLNAFVKCRQVVDLVLDDNPQITDIGLKNFEGIKTLLHLGLDNTQVTNTGLAYFKDCLDLQYLALYPSQATKKMVTDEGMKHFAGCKNLEQVQLGETGVGENSLKMLGGCAKLQIIRLGLTGVQDPWLKYLFKCEKLEEIDLYNTPITLQGVQALRKVFRKCKIQWPKSDMFFPTS